MAARPVHLAWLAASVVQGCAMTQPAAPVASIGMDSTPVNGAEPTPPGHYRVEAGDNLFRIAFAHGLDYRRLAAWNGLADPDRVQAGTLLRLTAPAVEAPPAPAEVSAATDWRWPVRGDLVAHFDVAAGRKGLDIAGQRGEAVRAAAAGKVLYAGAGLRGYGKLIIISHGKALLSAYGHHDRILVAEGQEVVAGQVIGEMGDSDADRVKLHFEIREYGRPVDPLEYLPGSPG